MNYPSITQAHAAITRASADPPLIALAPLPVFWPPEPNGSPPPPGGSWTTGVGVGVAVELEVTGARLDVER